jgi:hypothetical protein
MKINQQHHEQVERRGNWIIGSELRQCTVSSYCQQQYFQLLDKVWSCRRDTCLHSDVLNTYSKSEELILGTSDLPDNYFVTGGDAAADVATDDVNFRVLRSVDSMRALSNNGFISE